jgi:hydrogenase maturation protease
LASKRAVIIGFGNPSRGDDGIGPELMNRAEALVELHPEAYDVECIQDFQLQIEHSMDLDGPGMALFLDASVSAAPPFTLTRLRPSQDASYTTHELSPSSVLHVFEQVNHRPPPPCFLLSVRADQFDLGVDIAPPAMANLEAAWDLLTRLMANLDLAFWEAQLTPGAVPHA